MPWLPHILSAGNGAGGVVFIVLVLIFWAVSALANLSKKQKERERRLLDQMRAGVPVPPPVQSQNPFDPARLRPMERAQRQMSRAPRQKISLAPKAPARTVAPPRAPTKIVKPPAPRRRVLPTVAPMSRSQAAPILLEEVRERPTSATLAPRAPMAAAAPSARPVAPSATAPMLRRWLRPNTLRSQFILTELFQPPTALRDDRLEWF